MAIYSKEELEKLLFADPRECIYLPNSIFDELKNKMTKDRRNKSSKHIPFAYAYAFLTSYLWRYAKFGKLSGEYDYTENELKRLLTVSGNNKTMNYITKKNGVLDELGYIKKISDCPLDWSFKNGELDFFMLSNLQMSYIKISNIQSRKFNFPRRGYYENEEDEKEGVLTGYLFQIGEANNKKIKGSHKVSIETFIKCMSADDLGLEAFYIYHYIAWKSKFERYWRCSFINIANELGLGIDIVKDKIKALEEHDMINCKQGGCYRTSTEIKRKANGYKANEPKVFV